MRSTTDREGLIQMPIVCQGSHGKSLRISSTTMGSTFHKEGEMLGSSGPTWQLMLPELCVCCVVFFIDPSMSCYLKSLCVVQSHLICMLMNLNVVTSFHFTLMGFECIS